MPETYFVECDCGKAIRVELFEAGAEKACPTCNATVAVPASSRLKELSGDRYPMLRPLEKIERTAQLHEPPFDGHCHHCGGTDAAHQIPVTFNILVERYVSDDGGVRPTMTGGVKLVVGEAEEVRQTLTFPLLLCEQCHVQFQSSRSTARLKNGVKLLAVLGLLAAFLYFAWHNAEVIAAVSGLSFLVLVIALAARYRDSRKIDPFVQRWIGDIRWVPEAIESEDEFSVEIGRAQAYVARETGTTSLE